MSIITLTKLELASTTVTSIVAASLSKFENEIDIKIKIQRKVNTLFIRDDFKHKIVCFIDMSSVIPIIFVIYCNIELQFLYGFKHVEFSKKN